jgi:hypothetical protein
VVEGSHCPQQRAGWPGPGWATATATQPWRTA